MTNMIQLGLLTVEETSQSEGQSLAWDLVFTQAIVKTILSGIIFIVSNCENVFQKSVVSLTMMMSYDIFFLSGNWQRELMCSCYLCHWWLFSTSNTSRVEENVFRVVLLEVWKLWVCISRICISVKLVCFIILILFESYSRI